MNETFSTTQVRTSSQGKTYIACLLGLDPKFGFDREFVHGALTDRHSARSGKTGSATIQISALSDGVYEEQDWPTWTKKARKYMVVRDGRGEYISQDDARALLTAETV